MEIILMYNLTLASTDHLIISNCNAHFQMDLYSHMFLVCKLITAIMGLFSKTLNRNILTPITIHKIQVISQFFRII